MSIILNRAWAMPNKNTFDIKPIKDTILRWIPQDGLIIDPFANKNKIANITNDLDPQYDTNYHLDALDFLKQFEDNSVDCVLYDPPYCYDGDTEILTKDGFKNIKDVTMEDTIATLNTETNQLEYHKPLEVIHKPYCGDMVKIESQDVNLFVTPNHRCWVKESFDGNYKWKMPLIYLMIHLKYGLKQHVNGIAVKKMKKKTNKNILNYH